MTDDERESVLKGRYLAAAHAMQSGVGLEIETHPDSPKDVRVGINSALVDSAALAGLLIKKGVISRVEYAEALAEAMEAEKERYERSLTQARGISIKLG